MTQDPTNRPFQEDDDAMLEKKKSELDNLMSPEEKDYQGNDPLYREAMEQYFGKKKVLESEIEHLESVQRQIARGDLKGGFGIN